MPKRVRVTDDLRHSWIERRYAISVHQNGRNWKKIVEGIGNGTFGVHDIEGRCIFAITHLATGWKCFNWKTWKTPESACRAADYLAENYREDFRRIIACDRTQSLRDFGLKKKIQADLYLIEHYRKFGVSEKKLSSH